MKADPDFATFVDPLLCDAEEGLDRTSHYPVASENPESNGTFGRRWSKMVKLFSRREASAGQTDEPMLSCERRNAPRSRRTE